MKQNKKEEFCISAPEEVKFWSLKNKWKDSIFKEKRLNIDSVRIKSARSTGSQNVQRYTSKRPLILGCGIEIFSGQYGTTPQNLAGSFAFRIDSVIETNSAIAELSKITGLETWQVVKLEISNNDKGATLYYEMHNPDGTGADLYLARVNFGDIIKNWNEISMFEQQALCNNFYPGIAACTFEMKPVRACKVKLRKELENITE